MKKLFHALALISCLTLFSSFTWPFSEKKKEEKRHEQEDKSGALPSMLGWKDPDIHLSHPPKLMGKQMGKVDTIGVPPLGYEMDGDVKVFTLIAQPVEQILTDGTGEAITIDPFSKDTYQTSEPPDPKTKTAKVWGYNGTCPGPTLEANEGDHIRIVLKNELPEPTTIHWHGIELPNDEDGAGDVTQGAVLPGKSYTYEYILHQSGTFLYHTGFNLLKQDGMGLSGMIVVHPKVPPKKIDRDYAILLQEYKLDRDKDEEDPKVLAMDSNWFTMNGHVYPSVPLLKANQGQRVRIRLGNLSLQMHPFHLHGYTFKVVGTEGGPIPESAQYYAATVAVHPGQTRDIEFVAWNPGLWRFHCHVLHHILNNDGAFEDRPIGILPLGGMYTYLKVYPKVKGERWAYPPENERY